jgi:hypothetical protein
MPFTMGVNGLKGKPSGGVKQHTLDLAVKMKQLLNASPADLKGFREEAAQRMRELAKEQNKPGILALLDKGLLPGGAATAPPLSIETGAAEKKGWSK